MVSSRHSAAPSKQALTWMFAVLSGRPRRDPGCDPGRDPGRDLKNRFGAGNCAARPRLGHRAARRRLVEPKYVLTKSGQCCACDQDLTR